MASLLLRRLFYLAICCLGTLYLLSCSSLGDSSSSDTIGMDDFDQNNHAHGAAYVVDSMHVRRPMPGHKDWKPLEFYYKHCTELGDASYYSKTSYTCSDPF